MDAASKSDVALAALQTFIDSKAIDRTKDGWRTRLSKPPQVKFDAKKTYVWKLDTNLGTIEVKLMPDVAPMHASSTLYLTMLGFYDGLAFHRVITDFMAQGGCPRGNGTGGPGYEYSGEFSPKVRHDRPGLLSMANAGPGTDGSQFFLTFVATPWLDDNHTIFGEVVSGMDVLKQMEARGSSSGRTTEKLSITKATAVVR